MAQPIINFAVVEVAKPNIGEKRPSRVRADVSINLNVRQEIKSEWENLRKHDVCFLITLKPPNSIGRFIKYVNYTLFNLFCICLKLSILNTYLLPQMRYPVTDQRILKGELYYIEILF